MPAAKICLVAIVAGKCGAVEGRTFHAPAESGRIAKSAHFSVNNTPILRDIHQLSLCERAVRIRSSWLPLLGEGVDRVVDGAKCFCFVRKEVRSSQAIKQVAENLSLQNVIGIESELYISEVGQFRIPVGSAQCF